VWKDLRHCCPAVPMPGFSLCLFMDIIAWPNCPVFAMCLTEQVRTSTFVIGVSVRPYANDKQRTAECKALPGSTKKGGKGR
jgi:hypothetical protein